MDTRLVVINNYIKELEQQLKEFYARRNKDERVRMSVRSEDHGARELMNDGVVVSAPWRGEND